MPRFTPTVKDYMTAIPRWIGPHEPLLTARDVMSSATIRHLPVVDNAKLVGMIAASDLAGAHGLAGRIVADVMTPEPYAVAATTPLNVVAREMARRRIGSAVVMDGKTIAGILTEVDALNALADALEGKHARPLSEEVVRLPQRGKTRPTAPGE
jgi:acetoin utilization protein AcuB